jgi:S-adenosylmethionine hydrolase
LFSDYGWTDPYVGQVKAVLSRTAPGVAIIDLMHGAPDYNAHAAAHLLDALCPAFPAGAVFLCVVDPGVGGPRQAIVLEADGRWFVGPDNGLLSVVGERARTRRYWRIDWRPEVLSDTFHGRDLFAPIAAQLASTGLPGDRVSAIEAPEVAFTAEDLPRIIYIDHYGNAWTGVRGGLMDPAAVLEIRGHRLGFRRIFSDAAKGEAFWHVNSSGLVEIAANRAHAAKLLGLAVGDPVRLPVGPGSQSH